MALWWIINFNRKNEEPGDWDIGILGDWDIGKGFVVNQTNQYGLSMINESKSHCKTMRFAGIYRNTATQRLGDRFNRPDVFRNSHIATCIITPDMQQGNITYQFCRQVNVAIFTIAYNRF